jgi:hypothetical protein
MGDKMDEPDKLLIFDPERSNKDDMLSRIMKVNPIIDPE